MFFHNKTLPNSIWVQEFQIACKNYEIKLKKTASCGFGFPVEVYRAIKQ
ncbi:14219_t:CDS:1, partial [Dentiscutata heterogama]